MLTLYTIAIPQWRKAKEKNIELFDITVKSGYEPFAPYKDVLYAYKRGEISDDQYTDIYLNKLREHFRAHPEDFQNLLERDAQLAVACYCKAGKFCHRHLFIEFISQVAQDNEYDLIYNGEIV